VQKRFFAVATTKFLRASACAHRGSVVYGCAGDVQDFGRRKEQDVVQMVVAVSAAGSHARAKRHAIRSALQCCARSRTFTSVPPVARNSS